MRWQRLQKPGNGEDNGSIVARAKEQADMR
jgi:hypothetical protein